MAARNDEWYVAFVVEPAVLIAKGVFPAFEGTGVVLSANYGARPFVHGPPDSRFYSGVAPDLPLGHCEQLRGKSEAFALAAMWRPEVLRERAQDAVEWIRQRVSEHRDGYRRRCAASRQFAASPAGGGGTSGRSSSTGAPPAALRVQRIIPVCSSVSGGEATGDDVREQLEAIACAHPPLLPSIGFTIPQSWMPAITFLRALRDGLPHGEATRRALDGLPVMDPRVDGASERRRPYERVTKLTELWEETLSAVVQAHDALAVDVCVIDDALSLLAAQGEVFLSAGVAYLEPSYVACLMKPLVDHTLR